MNRKWKIILAIFVISIVGFGSFLGINHYLHNLQEDNSLPSKPPILSFPFSDINVLERLSGFSWDNETGDGHNGIDFMINNTATITASCNMTCNDKGLFHNELGEHWQAGCSFDINDDYELFYAFESFAENETFGNIQLEAITVEIGETVTQGQVIGQLFVHNPSAHIHYMLHKKNEPVCPYQYFSEEAKIIFNALWLNIGLGELPCNSTALECYH